MEVGAPARGIEVAHRANALTPRYVDLETGIWARGSFPPAALAVYAFRAAVARLSLAHYDQAPSPTLFDDRETQHFVRCVDRSARF